MQRAHEDTYPFWRDGDPRPCFRRCSALESVVLSPGTTNLWDDAFANCGSLKHIKLPSTLRSISDSVFSKCHSLVALKLPDQLTGIGPEAFFRCYNVKEVLFPDSLERIGDQAFYGCENLTKLRLPQLVREIGAGAFAQCTKLTKVVMGEMLRNYYVLGRPYMACFRGCGRPEEDFFKAASAELQLGYYWSRSSHAMCTLRAKTTIITVLRVCQRLAQKGTSLPILPDELWFLALAFLNRAQL